MEMLELYVIIVMLLFNILNIQIKLLMKKKIFKGFGPQSIPIRYSNLNLFENMSSKDISILNLELEDIKMNIKLRGFTQFDNFIFEYFEQDKKDSQKM